MNYQHKYLKYKSKYLEKKYGRKFRFRYKIDYDNDLYYKHKYLKYKSKYLNIYLKHSSANNNLDYQKYLKHGSANNDLNYQEKYFKYKSKYLNIKYGGTCKLEVDYDNNLDYQQKYFKYKSKYLYFKKQQEGGVFGALNAFFSPIGKVLEPVTTPVTTLLTPQTSTTPVKAPAATPTATPAATPAAKPATKAPAKPATTVVAKPAATPVTKPPPKVVVKPVAVPAVPPPPENTLQYTSPYKKETKTVLKIKNSKSQENIQTFLEEFYKKEQGRSVKSNTYDEIKKNIYKIINQQRIFNTTYNRFELPPYDIVPYDFNKFEVVKDVLDQVINSIDTHFNLKDYGANRAKIMDAVIEEYFDPNYEPKNIPEKTEKTGLFTMPKFFKGYRL